MTGNHEKLLRSSLYGKPHKHRYQLVGKENTIFWTWSRYIFRCRICGEKYSIRAAFFWQGNR